jgi:hypothetical protein
MGEKHRQMTLRRFLVADPDAAYICARCRTPWPCDSRRLLDEVEALRGALEHIAGQPTILIANPYSSFVRDALREEVMTQTANEPSTQQREGERDANAPNRTDRSNARLSGSSPER